MSDENPDVIPPRTGLTKRADASPATVHEVGRIDTGGVINSTITGWKARHQARALEDIANRHRKEADAIRAYGEVTDAFQETTRNVNQLRHLPETLALDDERMKADHAEEYDELRHRAQMNMRRRQREIEEADTGTVEAQRKKFTAEQGLENQQRLKERNFRIWEKRREAQEIDAHVETERMRAELRGDTAPPVPQSSLENMRAKAEEALITALADGNDAEVERWQRVLDALGE